MVHLPYTGLAEVLYFPYQFMKFLTVTALTCRRAKISDTDLHQADMALSTLQAQLQVVFKCGENKTSPVYRIPSLFYERESKTLLAFAEVRKTQSDKSTEKLIMRRGALTDRDGKKGVKWSPSEPVNEAKKSGYRPMNPCPVYDKNSGRLFLFFICIKGTASDWHQIKTGVNETRLCFITSDNLGKTWNRMTDLTDTLSEIKGWATFAIGPGHGLQTEEGRLIVPLYAYPLPSTSRATPKSGSSPVAHARSLYSDNSGEKWVFGTEFETLSIECEMAEFFDNGESVIYCNARNKGGYRVEALSHDKGESFEILTGGTLVETSGNGCQGSVIAFLAQKKDSHSADHSDQEQNKWLLFSHPNNETRRRDLAVYLNKSPRDPKTWSKPFLVYSGPSGYSDLAYIDDGWFVCLLECGKHSEVEQIACKVFHYKEISHDGEHDGEHVSEYKKCCVLL